MKDATARIENVKGVKSAAKMTVFIQTKINKKPSFKDNLTVLTK